LGRKSSCPMACREKRSGQSGQNGVCMSVSVVHELNGPQSAGELRAKSTCLEVVADPTSPPGPPFLPTGAFCSTLHSIGLSSGPPCRLCTT
jgi:hypothetical protein